MAKLLVFWGCDGDQTCELDFIRIGFRYNYMKFEDDIALDFIFRI